jgi:hypothetical protein
MAIRRRQLRVCAVGWRCVPSGDVAKGDCTGGRLFTWRNLRLVSLLLKGEKDSSLEMTPNIIIGERHENCKSKAKVLRMI